MKYVMPIIFLATYKKKCRVAFNEADLGQFFWNIEYITTWIVP